jgi:hypothetical protein
MELIFSLLGSFIMCDMVTTFVEGFVVFLSYLKEKIKGFFHGN